MEPLTHQSAINSTSIDVLKNCEGISPLCPRVEDWMHRCFQNPDALFDSVTRYQSPINVLSPAPFADNVRAIEEVAEELDIDLTVFFARKANKCVAFVEQAKRLDIGIDTASLQELSQCIDRGVDSKRLICTAAIKSDTLIAYCVKHGVVIAIDNVDELRLAFSFANETRKTPLLALRVSGFLHDGEKLFSRFGIDIDEVLPTLRANWPAMESHFPRIVGIHFHLDGYCPGQRVDALRQTIILADQLRSLGHNIEFIDMGGGFPMSYLESESQWSEFWVQHRKGLLGEREPLTFRNEGLGLSVVDGKVAGQRATYPFWQSPVQADWFKQILESDFGDSTIATELRNRALRLHCEPGRSVLDGCGMTVARVEFVKQHVEGFVLVGLAMNHTQCKTSSADFMSDPVLLRSSSCQRSKSQSGFLVGAYCTESELLLKRKLVFPNGVARGDLVAFVNTAGYFMHFRESRSHQFPLANNLIVDDSVLKLEE